MKPCSALAAQVLVGAPTHLECNPNPRLMLSHKISIDIQLSTMIYTYIYIFTIFILLGIMSILCTYTLAWLYLYKTV